MSSFVLGYITGLSVASGIAVWNLWQQHLEHRDTLQSILRKLTRKDTP